MSGEHGENITGPYPFTAADLAPERLVAGVRHTLNHFREWQAANPAVIAEHIDLQSDLMNQAVALHTPVARLGRRLSANRQKAYMAEKIRREAGYFSAVYLGELPDEETSRVAVHAYQDHRDELNETIRQLNRSKGQPAAIADVLESHVPGLRGVPEVRWMKEQLERLYRILPQHVLGEGGMGKVARTILGVMTIAGFDVRHDDNRTRAGHLRRVLPAAYAYGATYPIVDDTLHDTSYVSQKDRDAYDNVILEGLATGQPVDPARLPDHPLADELLRSYEIITGTFPILEYPHLYQAGRSIQLAQIRDASILPRQAAGLDYESLYPDIVIKATMTRVVANILGRRELPAHYYTRAINVSFINQLHDDFVDQHEDRLAERLTPFTWSAVTGQPGSAGALYDLMSYDAYISDQVYKGNPQVAEILAYFNGTRLASSIIHNRPALQENWSDLATTAELARFLRTAGRMGPHIPKFIDREDLKVEQAVTGATRDRAPQESDPRTFISDKLAYINGIIERYLAESERHHAGDSPNRLPEIERYTLLDGGKRLRPALTLMLAESLGIKSSRIEPLLLAIELFHTASLVFDDLPAQDNAELRRGRLAAHIAFDEAGAQLAGISMLSAGFGEIPKLRRHGFDPDTVSAISEYVGTILGPKGLCLGQDMDLYVGRHPEGATVDNIVAMYAYKSSTMLEAALVPLMMLAGRPRHEIDAIKRYAHHSGIVFQMKDDILDVELDMANAGNTNLVTMLGVQRTQELLAYHVDAAVAHLEVLPFLTGLLENMVRHFATRTR